MRRPSTRGIVYLIDKLHLGGAQTHLANLALGLDPDRYRPTLVCLAGGGETAELLTERGLPVEVLGTPKIYGLVALRALLGFVQRLRATRPAILHCYLSSANIFGSFAAPLARVPRLITTRRDTGFDDGRGLQRALRATNRVSDCVVSVSHDVADVVAERDGIGPPLLRVIANGIDLDRFRVSGRRDQIRRDLGIATTAAVVLSVGHLSAIKATDVLVDAAAEVVRSHPEAVFLKAGAGDEQERLEAQIARLGLNNSFRLLGGRNDIPDLLEAADIFALPSRSEGIPNAAIEAMAMGLPVVASRVGGIPEIIRDGVEGLLVPPDDAAALARACRDLIGPSDLARHLGEAARLRASNEFSAAGMAQRYQELYDELLATGS